MNFYIDTSVLLVYTPARGKEKERDPFVDKLFRLIDSRSIDATTSFYALHELYIFSLENAPEFELGSTYGKEAINKILSSKVRTANVSFAGRYLARVGMIRTRMNRKYGFKTGSNRNPCFPIIRVLEAFEDFGMIRAIKENLLHKNAKDEK